MRCAKSAAKATSSAGGQTPSRRKCSTSAIASTITCPPPPPRPAPGGAHPPPAAPATLLRTRATGGRLRLDPQRLIGRDNHGLTQLAPRQAPPAHAPHPIAADLATDLCGNCLAAVHGRIRHPRFLQRGRRAGDLVRRAAHDPD